MMTIKIYDWNKTLDVNLIRLDIFDQQSVFIEHGMSPTLQASPVTPPYRPITTSISSHCG